MDNLSASANFANTECVKLLPHNVQLYNDIISRLESGEHSIFYSQGTGLGKSFIFMKLVHEYFKDARILYVVPKIAIWNNVCHYKEFDFITDRVTLATFATFNRYPTNNIECEDYDVVFVDECHHMLSDIQGKNVKQFLDDMVSLNNRVFGMTATPEIDGVFVDEECFNVSCYGLDMFEAIEQGLMPKMDIAIGIKEDIDIPDNLREQYSVVGTKTLLETVIDDYKYVTHWLAYFTTKEELEQNESEMQRLFPEFKILKAYYGLDNTTEIISEFELSKQPVVLMTVSMFLEGMHLKNVGGVLLYRNVRKSHTYAQILGRLCVIGQEYTPVIVDVTGSILTMKKFYTPKSSRALENQRKVYERRDIFDVTSKGYRLFDLMDKLELSSKNEYRGVRWTSLYSLDRALGHSVGASATWLNFNKNKTVQEYIDLCLKDYSYKEYIDNGFIGRYRKDGYEYVDYQDLANQIGVPYAVIYYHMEIKKSAVNLRELKYKKQTDEQFHIEGIERGKVYKGIPLDTINSVAKALGCKTSTIHGWCKRAGVSDIKMCIDHYLLKADNKYKGVDISSCKSVAEHFGKTRGAVQMYIRTNNITLKEYVDIMEDKRTKKYPEYRGVYLQSMYMVSKQLNVSYNMLRNIKIKEGYEDLEQLVDYMYDKAEKSGVSNSEYMDGIRKQRKSLGPFYKGDDIANS